MKKISRYIIIMVTIMLSITACGKKDVPTETNMQDTASAVKDDMADSIDEKNDTVNEKEKTEEENSKDGAELNKQSSGIDVDLTQLSSTMVYSEVYNMMVTPDSYVGKNVKMTGQFAVYQDQSTGNYYYAVIIADATACCSQGLEFVLAGNHDYPADYPEQGTEITVIGEFQTYKEGDYSYCHLIDAEII